MTLTGQPSSPHGRLTPHEDHTIETTMSGCALLDPVEGGTSQKTRLEAPEATPRRVQES